MVHFELLQNDGILIIRPEGSLEAADFQNIGHEIDPYIEANGKLHGVLIDAESFPGWKDLAALVAHLKFAGQHHRKIERVAVASNSDFLTLAPQIAGHSFKPMFGTFRIRNGMKQLRGFAVKAMSQISQVEFKRRNAQCNCRLR